jgi:hypothetical protein
MLYSATYLWYVDMVAFRETAPPRTPRVQRDLRHSLRKDIPALREPDYQEIFFAHKLL